VLAKRLTNASNKNACNLVMIVKSGVMSSMFLEKQVAITEANE
jgi:hypothetical protein